MTHPLLSVIQIRCFAVILRAAFFEEGADAFKGKMYVVLIEFHALASKS